jgi:site-specific DNA recombinase
MMALVRAGGADVIVLRQYDRLYRQPRELEALIDDTEGIQIEAVYGGGYDLGTADGRTHARVIGAFARGEAEKKAERQKLANERDAAAGKPRKACSRAFGWKEDRHTLEPAEDEAIREAARAVLGNGTLAGIQRDWSRRGLRPTQAPLGPLPEYPWATSSIMAILLSPDSLGLLPIMTS